MSRLLGPWNYPWSQPTPYLTFSASHMRSQSAVDTSMRKGHSGISGDKKERKYYPHPHPEQKLAYNKYWQKSVKHRLCPTVWNPLDSMQTFAIPGNPLMWRRYSNSVHSKCGFHSGSISTWKAHCAFCCRFPLQEQQTDGVARETGARMEPYFLAQRLCKGEGERGSG